MNKISSLHNKTKEIDVLDMPYNDKNIILSLEALSLFLYNNGIDSNSYKINDINLYRTAFVHQSYCTMKNLDFINGEKSSMI